MKKVRSRPKSQVLGKRRNPLAKRVPVNEAKPAFIGRLKGVFRIVGDIETSIEPETWNCHREADLERINQAAEPLNAEASDALDYQTSDPRGFPADAKRRGRGRPRHTS